MTGLSAAAHLGWRMAGTDEQVLVRVPNTHQPVSCSFATILRSRVEGGVDRLGVRIALPEVILVDCARDLSDRQLLAVVATAVQRREVELSAIALLVNGHARMRGAPAMRPVLHELAGGAESVREVDTLAAFVRLGLPAPCCQVWIFDLEGNLVSICDFYWDSVAVFYDGALHLSAESQVGDGLKRAALEALGLQVPVITKHLLGNETLLERRIRAARSAAAAVAAANGPPQWITRNAAEAKAHLSRRGLSSKSSLR